MVKSYIVVCMVYSALLLLAAPFLAVQVNDYQAISELARIVEGPALHFIFGAFCIGGVVCILGARVAGILTIAASAVMAFYIVSLLKQPEMITFKDGRVIRVLSANIESYVGGDMEPLANNVKLADPDVVILLEANNAIKQLISSSGIYPYELPCGQVCDLVAFSKFPIKESSRAKLISIWPSPRYGQVTIEIDEKTSATVVPVHLTKAWVPQSIFEPRRLQALLAQIDGPLIIAGDFNAAPWSLRMRQVADDNDIYFKRLSPATWPVRARQFGIPIDHIGVRTGAEILSLEGWDGAIDSNHRGLLAEIKIRSK